MAQTYHSRHLQVMRENERRMTSLFDRLSSQVIREVVRYSQGDGTVPVSSTYDLQKASGRWVTSMFLGSDRRGGLSAFEVLSDSSLFPLSPYMRAMWDSIETAMRIPVEQSASIMEKYLTREPELALYLRVAHTFDQTTSEQARTNPLSMYAPPHLWIDRRGYQLSERIWRTSGYTRRKLDMYLEQAIAEGKSAMDMAEELQTFLKPGRALARTRMPYGTDASFDAMRLARTEITRAAGQAHEMSALVNPFVTHLGIRLSASHPEVDICDEAAAGGPYPKDDIPPQYLIGMHPHCLCTYYNVLTDNPDEAIAGARAQTRQNALTPMALVLFVQFLLTGIGAVKRELSPL